MCSVVLGSRVLFLMILGFQFGSLGLENQGFGFGGIAKIIFRRSWISHDSRVHFFMILNGFGINFQNDKTRILDPTLEVLKTRLGVVRLS